MVAGGILVVAAVVVVGIIANSGRISSDTGNDLTTTGYTTQKRNACITDLRSEADAYLGDVSTAVLNRLAVLDGYNPDTGAKIIAPTEADLDEIKQVLADGYVLAGLRASDKLDVAITNLRQPRLNSLCGKPIISKDDD